MLGKRNQILRQISQLATRHRQGNGKRVHFPDSLKDLVVSAVEMGYSKAEVAKSAGVSGQAVANWAGCIRPRELKVIGAIPAPAEEPLTGAVARIHFRSGMQIELPVSALSSSLITMLSGGVQ